MGSDAAAAGASSLSSKDIAGRRKKGNRSAKLKQCKLDARREQWFAQVKKRSSKVVNAQASPHLPISFPHLEEEQACPTRNLESMKGDTPNNDVSSQEYSSRTDSSEQTRELHHEDNNEEILDDWEAVADTLTAGGDDQSAIFPDSTPVFQKNHELLRKPEQERRIPRAWRLDDILRPQSLPISSAWLCQRTASQEQSRLPSEPPSCPICYEDLDPTDSSFHPCSCGFRLCLFCHKRVLEADGRCPGCRKLYGPNGTGDMPVTGGASLLSLLLSCSLSMGSPS